jgi:hypothetical protein
MAADFVENTWDTGISIDSPTYFTTIQPPSTSIMNIFIVVGKVGLEPTLMRSPPITVMGLIRPLRYLPKRIGPTGISRRSYRYMYFRKSLTKMRRRP